MAAVSSIFRNGSGVFWGEMSPGDHLCQIYGNDDSFLDALEGFVGGGIRAQESVIVIATQEHIASLDARLEALGLDIESARAEDRYIALSAEDTLAKFMVNGWPEERQFSETVSAVISRARAGDRRVRAFGEMVAILWARGHYAATVRLEHLWNKLLKTEKFPLFCAYPQAGFSKGAAASIRELSDAHSKVIAA
jgi:hypothetical protein